MSATDMMLRLIPALGTGGAVYLTLDNYFNRPVGYTIPMGVALILTIEAATSTIFSYLPYGFAATISADTLVAVVVSGVAGLAMDYEFDSGLELVKVGAVSAAVGGIVYAVARIPAEMIVKAIRGKKK